MKVLLPACSLLVLCACTQPPAQPAGTYRLSMDERSMVLQVRVGGDYILQMDGPGREADEIRGRWEEEHGAGPNLSFHGIVWRGTEPEAGLGIWAAAQDADGSICLGERDLACFLKDAAG